MSKFGKKFKEVSNVIKHVLYSFCVGHTVISLIGQPTQVDGTSMRPTLSHCDWVFISYWKYRTEKLKRGDIVAFISHRDPERFVVKRIIALEGDIVKNDKAVPHEVLVPTGKNHTSERNCPNAEFSSVYNFVGALMTLHRAERIEIDLKTLISSLS